MSDRNSQYDVIIVGAGLAGGIVAGRLAEAGRQVLLLERGTALRDDQIPGDHLRNHRLSLYGDNTSDRPEDEPRVWVDGRGNPHIVQPHESAYQHNAFTVGGGARVWGMQAWRFHPDDFPMASRYGVPAGSSLSAWPTKRRCVNFIGAAWISGARFRRSPPLTPGSRWTLTFAIASDCR